MGSISEKLLCLDKHAVHGMEPFECLDTHQQPLSKQIFSGIVPGSPDIVHIRQKDRLCLLLTAVNYRREQTAHQCRVVVTMLCPNRAFFTGIFQFVQRILVQQVMHVITFRLWRGQQAFIHQRHYHRQ
jgi:hypothetical protein